MDNSRDKKFRGLEIYDRLRRGERLVKEDLANEYGVSLKTIQRDIDELRDYLFEKKDEIGEFEIIVKNKEYIYTAVSESDNTLTQQDILALSKILLESRAFNKMYRPQKVRPKNLTFWRSVFLWLNIILNLKRKSY